MLFHLTTLNLTKFLMEDALILPKGETNKEKQLAVDAWKHVEYICKNYILKDWTTCYIMCIWCWFHPKSLEFPREEVHNYSCWFKEIYCLKIYGLQNCGLHNCNRSGPVNLGNSTWYTCWEYDILWIFKVATIIEKLSPPWRDFKNYLKHKRKEIKFEELVVRLRIEEKNRKAEKCTMNSAIDPKATIVENKPQHNKIKWSFLVKVRVQNHDSQKSSMTSTTTATKWEINLRIVVSQRIFSTKMLMLLSQLLMKY